MSVILFGLLVAGWGYARGTATVWRLAGRGRGVREWQAVAFGGGWCAIAIALVSPLDTLASSLFSAHMAQHLVLIAIAAPLLGASRAHVALLWALPRGARASIAHLPHVTRWARRLAVPAVAFGVHSLALWVWHAPPLYEAALRNDVVHAVEHLSLLGTGVLCWSCIRGGSGVLYVFALAAQCTGLGALITTARTPWYGYYAMTAQAYGLSPMDDQVLAGALMWVPGGFVYLGLALVLLGTWLRAVPISAKQQQPHGANDQGSREQRQYRAKPQQVS